MLTLRVRRFVPLLAGVLGAAFATGCGGGGSGSPTPPPPPPPPHPPVTGPVTPGSTLATQGYSSGTFTFSFGSGAPAGETMTLAFVPQPVNSCTAPTCTASIPPADQVMIAVGPAALPLSAVAGIGLNGFPPPEYGGAYSFSLVDPTVSGYTTFNTSATGGAFVEAHAFPDETNPLTAFQPGRLYLLQLWPFPSRP